MSKLIIEKETREGGEAWFYIMECGPLGLRSVLSASQNEEELNNRLDKIIKERKENKIVSKEIIREVEI